MTAIAINKSRFQIVGLLLCTAASPICFGQPNFQVPVTGLCQGHETEPGCVLPNLFGPYGISLDPTTTTPPHYAHFIGQAQSLLTQALGSAIATQLAILPIVSPSSGFTYKWDKEAGAFVRTTTSFGPVYTERAETIGRGKVSFGTAYQRYRFSNLDGIDLHNVPALFTHLSGTGPNGTVAFYEADVMQTTNNIGLNMDQALLYSTVGITNRLDVSVVVPIISVRMSASSNATIITVADKNGNKAHGGTDPHQFPDGGYTAAYSSNGSASGIGDVTFRIKGSLPVPSSLHVALAMDVRAPSGGARQFLGSGATGIKPFVVISVPKRFSPHVNLGYQWNGSSILAGNLTGVTGVSVNPDGTPNVQNGPAIKRSLPGQFIYSLGADVGVTSRMTFAFDYLGQTLFDAQRAFLTSYTTQDRTTPIPPETRVGLPSMTIPTISGGTDTVGLNSGSAGVKLNLFGNMLLTGNILFRLDSKGLRQDVTPLASLSYAFGH